MKEDKIKIKIARGLTIRGLELDINRIVRTRENEVERLSAKGQDAVRFDDDSFVPCGSVSYVDGFFTMPMMRKNHNA